MIEKIKHFEGKYWVICPICKKKLAQILYDTEATNFPIFCRGCRSDHIISRIYWQNGEQIADFKE